MYNACMHARLGVHTEQWPGEGTPTSHRSGHDLHSRRCAISTGVPFRAQADMKRCITCRVLRLARIASTRQHCCSMSCQMQLQHHTRAFATRTCFQNMASPKSSAVSRAVPEGCMRGTVQCALAPLKKTSTPYWYRRGSIC